MNNHVTNKTMREIIEAYWDSDWDYGKFPEFVRAEAEAGGGRKC